MVPTVQRICPNSGRTVVGDEADHEIPHAIPPTTTMRAEGLEPP